ncbi:MAG TPA: hypothetical protein VF829_02965 [Candidatus Paceibacterota bacterium]
MDDQQRKSDFEQSAHDSWRWILEGEKLSQAANYLHKEYTDALEAIKKKSVESWPPGAEMLAPMIFIRAISLENLVKALYIKYGNSVTDGNGKLDFNKHDLLWFYRYLDITLSRNQENTLEKLSQAIYSWGRYPVPKSYKQWRQDVPGITGMQPIFTWSEENSVAYSEVLEKTRELLKDITRGQKPPVWYR